MGACSAHHFTPDHPLKVAEVCDECGGKLYQRNDDNKETIVKRLEVYNKETAPLKDFYREQGKLKSIQGRGGMEDIFSKLCDLVT